VMVRTSESGHENLAPITMTASIPTTHNVQPHHCWVRSLYSITERPSSSRCSRKARHQDNYGADRPDQSDVHPASNTPLPLDTGVRRARRKPLTQKAPGPTPRKCTAPILMRQSGDERQRRRVTNSVMDGSSAHGRVINYQSENNHDAHELHACDGVRRGCCAIQAAAATAPASA
jgi:hypothetical protein